MAEGIAPHMVPMAAVSSPCIRICILDEARGLCEGCGRTRDEIAAWGAMPEGWRRAVMAELPERMRRAGLAEPALPAGVDGTGGAP